MKSEAIPRTGIVDALGAGLTEAARRPLLWIVPIAVDMVLWLAPRLSITALTTQLVDKWREWLPLFVRAEQMAAAAEALDSMQSEMLRQTQSLNLGGALTAGWLAPPSALMPAQATRYLMFSDALLAPASLVPVRPLAPSPWQTTFELGSPLAVMAVVAALWVISQVLTALYFRMTATALSSRPLVGKMVAAPGVRQPAPGPRSRVTSGWLELSAGIAVLSLIASFGCLMLRLPLFMLALLAGVSGSGGATLLFYVAGGITLWLTMWFLSSLFFVGDALAFDGLPLGPSFMQSLMLVRSNGFRVLVLASLVNVLMLGARAIWGIAGDNPVGGVLAIIMNGYLATAMLIGIYVYYQDLRRHLQAAQLGRQLSK